MKPTHVAIIIASLPACPFSNQQAKTMAGLVASTHIEWLATNRVCAIMFNSYQQSEDIAHALRSFIDTARIDVIVIPYELYSRKKLVCVDINSALVKTNDLDELTEILIDHKLTHFKAKTEKQDQTATIIEKISLLEGLRLAEVKKSLLNRLTFTSGLKTMIETSKKSDTKLALISSGFSLLTDVICRYLSFDDSFANELEVKDGLLTGRIIGSLINDDSKDDIVRQLMQKYEIDAGEVLVIGDGDNGLPRQHGDSVGLIMSDSRHNKSIVDPTITPQPTDNGDKEDHFANRVHYNDMIVALYVQGYNRDEFTF